jgi:hypothetical protein
VRRHDVQPSVTGPLPDGGRVPRPARQVFLARTALVGDTER